MTAARRLTILSAPITMTNDTTGSPGREKPLIVQGDRSLLLEVASPRYAEARDALVRFAEIVKSPEHVHTYRITPLSIWNACAAGESAPAIVGTLRELSRFPVPEHIETEIGDWAGRYGSLTLLRDSRGLVLSCRDRGLADLAAADTKSAALLGERLSDTEFLVPPAARGQVKLALIRIGYPVDDRAGYAAGEPLAFGLRTGSRQGSAGFAPRPYQREAAAAFHPGAPSGAARG